MKPEELEVVRLTEANLLGSLLIAGSDGDTKPITSASKLLRADDFLPNYLDGLHRRIFQAMLQGQTDQITVANAMNDTGTLKPGDIAYMSELISDAVSGLDCEHYARLVADNAAQWRSGGRAKPRFSGVI
ncbi:MAG: DnaB-like helicase N-terminal domain-containing protein [Dehalococcoidales bacterium]|nr:DnaB-like helicase N-terminal domain-containing protein [Dehalococcoidales bacterium]